MNAKLLKKSFYRNVYFLAHAYKHGSVYGTGIRTLLDIGLYHSRKGAMDEAYIAEQLERLQIRDFEECCRALAERLFGMPRKVQAEESIVAERPRAERVLWESPVVERFRTERVPEKSIVAERSRAERVLEESPVAEQFRTERVSEESALTPQEREMLERMEGAGTYGRTANRVWDEMRAIQGDGKPLKRQTRLRYLFRKIFPGIAWYRANTPFACRHRWALPFCWLYRLFLCVFADGRHSIQKLRVAFTYPEERP